MTVVEQPQKPTTIVVIGVGGTIACAASDPRDLCNYSLHGRILDVQELLDALPVRPDAERIEAVSFRNVISEAVGPNDWLALHRVVAKAAATDGCRGIVITHGTSSLEETAYFLDLTFSLEMPVVLVGAQRPLSGLSSDAPLNLLNAIRLARAEAARGLGVLTLLNDEINPARDSTKTSNYRLHAFRSGELGPLGFVDPDGCVQIYRRPRVTADSWLFFPVTGLDALPRVDIVAAYAGADEVAIEALAAAGARGLVIAGFHPGSATPAQMRALAEIRRRGIAVAFSTRGSGGRVIRRDNLTALGAIAAADLTPQKARILLMLALTQTDDPERLQELFDRS